MEPDAVPIPLAPALLSRLERELTDPLLDRVRRYALTRVAVKRRRGVPCYDNDDHEAEVMAQDAVTLTVLGHRTWNPDVELFGHLCGVIWSESSAVSSHAKKFRHASVDALAMDDSQCGDDKIHADISRYGRARSSRPGREGTTREASDRLLEHLRVLAYRDPTVTLLLAAYEAGCDTRKEVLAVTRLSPGDYRNARRKLDRMLAALPDHLNDDAHDALEITHEF